MRVYYYRYMDMWLTCRAKNKKEAARLIGGEELLLIGDDLLLILTELEAKKRAEHDPELADFMQSTWLCELMCN